MTNPSQFTPYAFTPEWRAVVGMITHTGKGLLDRDIRPLKDVFDEFKVLCGSFSITAKPKLGQMFVDNTLAAQFPLPCELRWFRRIHASLSTSDPNHCTPDCEFYGLGLESGGQTSGYKIKSDGTAQWGDLS